MAAAACQGSQVISLSQRSEGRLPDRCDTAKAEGRSLSPKTMKNEVRRTDSKGGV